MDRLNVLTLTDGELCSLFLRPDRNCYSPKLERSGCLGNSLSLYWFVYIFVLPKVILSVFRKKRKFIVQCLSSCVGRWSSGML